MAFDKKTKHLCFLFYSPEACYYDAIFKTNNQASKLQVATLTRCAEQLKGFKGQPGTVDPRAQTKPFCNTNQMAPPCCIFGNIKMLVILDLAQLRHE